ncbi:DUF2163 domain-containing protein [Sinorhizobium sp. BG8]|uniref:DUF2163 domain-containing protein n=1 Tax=Sinorhizobium sp. BG8 TaxID=2613773 RepID=UPI00193E472A|nr:DUF2163 domain-containing protein [Sinorhizobium sp. BG8]QRM54760.1 DUF2163 domain-containing protein [Sinorhizobium sp. BG8]
MRTIPDALAGHLEGDATTICHAWRVTRRDGTALGFTEHDHDLVFAGTTFLAASGFQASDTEETSGLSAEASEVAGAFSSEAIRDEDLTAGRYDGARVEVFVVNWQAPSERVLLRVGEIGEVTRAGDAFRAEIRRLTHSLDQVKGRVYAHRCDAVLGDERCGVNVASSAFRSSGTVVRVKDELRLEVEGLSVFTSRFFRYGLLTFSSGENDGLAADVEDHRTAGGTTEIVLWLPMPRPVSPGDVFSIVAGCDKRFSTCRKKFANALNFRGFPHMPGSDFTYSYADGDTEHDGRPLYE